MPVTNVRYIASQPWPFPSSLMIACVGQAEHDVITLDTNELEDAIWVSRDDGSRRRWRASRGRSCRHRPMRSRSRC